MDAERRLGPLSGSEELIWRHQTASNYENTRNRIFDTRLRELCRSHSFCSSEVAETAGTESESPFNSTSGNCDDTKIYKRITLRVQAHTELALLTWGRR